MAFLVHRWLGIALALLMAVWTVSGIVMMYVSFPDTTTGERLAGLEPLDLSACCENVLLPGGVAIEGATVEMVAGEPVLRWSGPRGTGLVSLSDTALPHIGEAEARAVATTYMRRAFGAAPPVRMDVAGRDQWTVSGYFDSQRPLYKASFADDRGTVLYVSGTTGEVVQDTNRRERFWNWLGAVPHWLYFTILRENTPLWSNVVIYASLLGTFLTLIGIYIGIRMFRRGKHISPYRGIALWHHWTGLIFGVLTLTWVFSGLTSMQPWGWMQSDGPGKERAALAGRPVERADAMALVRALAAHPRPGVVSAKLSIQGGKPYAILVEGDGSRARAALPDLAPAPLSPAELQAKVRAAKPGVPLTSAGLIREGDAYHYSHHTQVILPAYRAIYADEGETWLYLDPRTGELIDYADAGARQFRWWHLGLHRLDFAFLRQRPLWDIVLVPLLIGVSLLCLLGLWMGVRRLRGMRQGHSGAK